MNDDNDIAEHDSLPKRFRLPAWVGLGLCLFPAALLAACGLTSSGDTTSDARPVANPAAAQVPIGDTPATVAASSTQATTASTTPGVAPISFASQVEPIIESTCANCHIGTGPGTTHIRLDNAGIVAKASIGISSVVSSGEMPPWPASDDSTAFNHDWSLTTDQIDTLIAWGDAGSPLDVPADHPIVPSQVGVRLEDPDAIIPSNGAFDGTDAPEDEYRCFVYDLPTAEAGGFLTAFEFLPDQETVVHHAITFLVNGADRESIEALDATDENGGWTCFGFNPSPSAKIVGGWAPGQSATRSPDGTGLSIAQNDFLVIQTHYHFDDGVVIPPPDQSEMAIEIVADTDPQAAELTALDVQIMVGPAEIPCRTGEIGPLCERDAALAAAVSKYGPPGALGQAILGACGATPADFAHMTEGIASASCDNKIRTTGDLVTVHGHEHEIGASFRMTLHPDTPEEVVVLDIPKWDFDWQLVYQLAEPIQVEAGDVVRIECSWDRSLRDPNLEPSYVLWSEGTNDEMCFSMIAVSPVDG